MKTSGSVAKACRQGTLRPGFESQVPHNFHVILLNVFTCRPSKTSHHAPHVPACHVASSSDPKAGDG